MKNNERMKYHYLIAINLETGKREIVCEEKLRFYLENKRKFRFVCACNPDEEIPMIIQKPASNQKDVVIFRSEHGDKKKHKSGCYYRNGVCSLESGMWINKDGKFEAEVEFGKMHKPVNPPLGGSGKGNPSEPRKREMRRGKQTFQAFSEQLMLKSWNSYYMKSYIDPNFSNGIVAGIGKGSFEKYMFGYLHQFVLNKMELYDMYTRKGKKKRKLKIGEVIMDQNREFKGSKSMICYRVLGYGYEEKLFIDPKLFEDRKGAVRKNKFERLMCFAVLNENDIVQDIAFVPCNRYWLYAESSYECLIYNLLIMYRYLFLKPEQRVDLIKYPFVADAIIKKESFRALDNEIFSFSDEYNTILEIFGVCGNEDYNNRKYRKDMIGQSLNESDPEWRYESFDRNFLDNLNDFDEKFF